MYVYIYIYVYLFIFFKFGKPHEGQESHAMLGASRPGLYSNTVLREQERGTPSGLALISGWTNDMGWTTNGK